MNYNIAFDNNRNEFDKVYESQGVEIYCDLKSWIYLKGTEIDFSDDIYLVDLKLQTQMHQEPVVAELVFSISHVKRYNI